jgi:SAM-dependent methyltransferase
MTEASDWQGRVGDVWAEEWRRTDRAMAPLNDALVAAVAAQGAAPLAILDIGCGAGTTSLALADQAAGAEITGIDLSGPLIAVARARARGRAGVRFEVADASSWSPAAGRFDTIVSRHGIMFFDDPVAAFSHLRSLGRPEARLVFSCFRDRAENQWASALRPIFEGFAPEALAAPPPAVGPFAFGDPARVTRILSEAGFAAPQIRAFDFDFVAGAGDQPVADALAFFRRIGPFAALLDGLDEARRGTAVDQLATILASHVADGRVAFRAAAWIVSTRIDAGKPA